MSPRSPVSEVGWSFLGRWLIATAVGSIVGLLGAIVLSDLVVNLVYPKETNLIVGICTGAAVGFFQMIAARPWITLSRGWVWGAMVGMGIPFVAVVLVDEFGLGVSALPLGWLFGLTAITGAVIGGLLQARVLRPYTSRASWWVAATIVSWAPVWLLGVLPGGIVMGVVGGGLFIWLLRAPVAGEGGD